MGMVNIFEKAVVIVTDNSMRFGDGTTINQSQLNTGNQTTLSGVWGPQEDDKLRQFIESIQNAQTISPEEATDAVDTLTDLKAKKEAGTLRPSYLKRMWEALPDAVKLLNGAIEIFKMFGGAI